MFVDTVKILSERLGHLGVVADEDSLVADVMRACLRTAAVKVPHLLVEDPPRG